METVVAIETWGIPEAYAKGRYPGGSLYSKQTGDSCCLGFSTIQAGVQPEMADGLAYPVLVSLPMLNGEPMRVPAALYPEALKAFGDPANKLSTPLAQMAATINDNEEIGWESKCALLTSLFEIHGQGLTFTFNGNVVYVSNKTQVKAIDTFLKRKREKHSRKLKRAMEAIKCMNGEEVF